MSSSAKRHLRRDIHLVEQPALGGREGGGARRPGYAGLSALKRNSPAIAFELSAESIHVIVTPGEVDQHMRLIGGRWASEFLSGLNIDMAFISCAGITLEEGLTTSRRALADVVNAARAVARRCVALVDSTKFGRASLLTMARPDGLDLLIVDTGLPAEIVDEYRRAGVPIEVAGEVQTAN